MQIAKTGRPWRRWHRRQFRHYSYYHAPTTTTAMTTTTSTSTTTSAATSTCLLELGPAVNDTLCRAVDGFNEITPQDCAEKCQEVYGDTMGSIGFTQTIGIPCSCCVGDDTVPAADYTYYNWTKPCGGPFLPCGDRDVIISSSVINETCPNNTGFQEFTDLTVCAEECTITLGERGIKVVSNSTHCACCKSDEDDTESAPGFVVNIANCDII